MEDYNIDLLWEMMMSPHEANWKLVKAMELPVSVREELWKKVCKTLIYGEYQFADDRKLYCAWHIELPFYVAYDLYLSLVDNDILIRLYYRFYRVIDKSAYIDYTEYGAVINTLSAYYIAVFSKWIDVLNHYNITDTIIKKAQHGGL